MNKLIPKYQPGSKIPLVLTEDGAKEWLAEQLEPIYDAPTQLRGYTVTPNGTYTMSPEVQQAYYEDDLREADKVREAQQIAQFTSNISNAQNQFARTALPYVLGATAGPLGITLTTAGQGVDAVVEGASKGKYSDWGDMVYQASGSPNLGNVGGVNIARFVAGSTNPAYVTPIVGGGIHAYTSRPKVGIRTYTKPWRSDLSKTNQATAIYLKDRPSQYFELVKDNEPGNYSIHFKTRRGGLSDAEKSVLFKGLVEQIPEGARVSTWGEVSPGGFSALRRLTDQYGLKRTGLTRRVGMKSPEVDPVFGERVGVDQVDIPILHKGDGDFYIPQKPNSPISFAERLGIPKGERNNFNRFQREGLDDLEQYVNSGQYRQNPSLIDGQIIWKSSPTNQEFLDAFNIHFDSSTGEFKSGSNYKGLPVSVYGFPHERLSINGGDPASGGWIAAAVPVTDANTRLAILSPGASGQYSTVPLRNATRFYEVLSDTQQPGTYVSGDFNSVPLGESLIDLYKRTRMLDENTSLRQASYQNIFDKLYEKPQINVREEGLSTDSYTSLIRRGSKDPNFDLRYGFDGFKRFNVLGQKHSYLRDLLDKANAGEIPQSEFLKAFHDAVAPYGGMDAKVVNGQIIIPHPFLYKRKRGGLLKRRL